MDLRVGVEQFPQGNLQDELKDIPDITMDVDAPAVEPSATQQPDACHANQPPPPPSRRATVEDVEDEGDHPQPTSTSSSWEDFVESFPAEFEAGAPVGAGETPFEKIRSAQQTAGHSSWAEFEDQEEWELGKWMVENLGQNEMESFLKLRAVRKAVMIDLLTDSPSLCGTLLGL